MNDTIRYKSIGSTFYGIKQCDCDDILDMEFCTWTDMQLQSDLLNKTLPVGLLIIDITDEKVYRVNSEKVAHGHKHNIEAVMKGLYGSETDTGLA